MFERIGARSLSRRLVIGGLGAFAASARGGASAAAAPTPRKPSAAGEGGALFSAQYLVHVGGLRLGEIALRVSRADGRYAATATARSAGAAAWLVDLRAEAEAEGALDGAHPAPERFSADGAFGDERRRMVWRFGPDLVVEAEPPFRDRPYDPSPAQLRGALDPISGAVAAFVPHPAEAVGDRTLAIYDGRRRVDVAIGPARATGARLRAEARAAPVAGFKAKHRARPPFPLTVWWRVEDGLATLDRAEAPTPFGAAVLRRA